MTAMEVSSNSFLRWFHWHSPLTRLSLIPQKGAGESVESRCVGHRTIFKVNLLLVRDLGT